MNDPEEALKEAIANMEIEGFQPSEPLEELLERMKAALEKTQSGS